MTDDAHPDANDETAARPDRVRDTDPPGDVDRTTYGGPGRARDAGTVDGNALPDGGAGPRDDVDAASLPAETDVPPGADPHVCAYCGRPFAREEYLALHRGLDHADHLSEADRERFDEAYAEEEADIRRFRIVALGALVLLYFGFLFAFEAFASLA